MTLLQNALKDRDSRVRANAVEAIEIVLGEASAITLKPLLTDPDNRTRSNAAKALFKMGDIAVLSQLEKMLTEKDTPTRISAAYALGQIGQSLRELERSPLLSPLKSSLGTVKLQDIPGKQAKPLSTSAAELETKPPPVGKDALREFFLEHYNAGRLKEALDGTQAYLAQFPHDLMANFFAGNLNFQLSRFEAAIGFFKKTVEIDPFHVQAHSNLAISCYREGRIQEAIHFFKQALKIQPDLSVLRFNLGNLLLKENKWEEAIFQYEEGRRYQKAPPRVLANLGFAYQKTGQYEKAVYYYEESANADPRDAGVYYNWALILIRQGKKEEAQAILQHAIKSILPGSAGLKTIRELIERIKT